MHDRQLPGPQDVLSDGEDDEAGPHRVDVEAGGLQQAGKTAAVPQAQQRRWGATYSTQLRILFVRQDLSPALGVACSSGIKRVLSNLHHLALHSSHPPCLSADGI